jgi:hypothetical protein
MKRPAAGLAYRHLAMPRRREALRAMLGSLASTLLAACGGGGASGGSTGVTKTPPPAAGSGFPNGALRSWRLYASSTSQTMPLGAATVVYLAPAQAASGTQPGAIRLAFGQGSVVASRTSGPSVSALAAQYLPVPAGATTIAIATDAAETADVPFVLTLGD